MSFYLLYTINIPKKNEKGKKNGDQKDIYRRKANKTLAPRIREIHDAMIRENPDD